MSKYGAMTLAEIAQVDVENLSQSEKAAITIVTDMAAGRHTGTKMLADITYCTNKEVSADFLRDRIVLGVIKSSDTALLSRFGQGTSGSLDRVVQPGLNYAIVDEVDSVLICPWWSFHRTKNA